MTSFLGALPAFTSRDENVSSGVAGIGSRTIQDLGDIMGFENQVHIQPILENIEYSKSLAVQAASLLKGGHISQTDYEDIIREASRYTKVGQQTVQELNALYPTLKKTLSEAVNSIGQGAASGPRLGVAEAKKLASRARETASKTLAEAKAQLGELQASINSVELLLKTTLSKVTAGAAEIAELTARGAPVSEIQAASVQLARDQATYQASISNTNALTKAFDTATFATEQLAATSSQAIVKADLALESAKVYEGGSAISSGGVRLIARAIGAYTDPMKKLAFRLKRVGKLVTQGYEGFARTLIVEGNAEAFIEEMNNLAGDKAAQETQAIRDQLAIVKDMMKGEELVTEEVVAECAKWMSPSWRMAASLSEDIVYFAESLNIAKFTDYFVVLGRGAFVLIQALIKVPLMAAAAAVEAVVGELIATVIVDLTEAVVVGISEISSAILAPEVLAVLYVFYGFIDAFKVHNFWEWVNDMVSAVITPGLTDKIYPLRIRQYPEQSIKGTKDIADDPAGMLKIDSDQFKATIDFWGKAFVDEISRIRKGRLRYTPFESYHGIMRVPGKYIDPRNHPYDTQEELDTCLETERYFDKNLMQDETGKLNGDGSVLPQLPGLVRNIVQFPVYQQGVVWPDLDGTLVQTKGKFVEDSVDDYIVRAWKQWITTGEWGPAFTHPGASEQAKQEARFTNIADYNDFMSPQRDYKFAWTNVYNWVLNNKGKKKLIEQVISGDQYHTELAERTAFHGGDTTKATEDMLWKLYLLDTQSTRTQWGYISKVRTLLLVETQQTVNVLSGVRKSKIWERWIATISRTGVPLNTNRYHRLTFVGRLNQLVYAEEATRKYALEEELEKVGGRILENRLITTGSISDIASHSWAKAIEKRSITALTEVFDVPVFFGNMHCRIIVMEKPKLTCFIVFRGTTNAWEWVVDLDFTSAEFGTIVEGSLPGTFEMVMSGKSGSTSLSNLVQGSPDTFTLHRGFLRAWLAFKPEVTRQLLDIYEMYRIEDVIVTGHSLGAGITQIACLELPSVPTGRKHTTMGHTQQVVYKRPHAYMYASPAVGDTRFAWHFVNQTSESAHAYIDGDIVTMIPPLLLPSKESWGVEVRDSYFNDVVKLTESGSGAGGVAWYIASRAFQGMNIPYTPDAWKTNGSWDWTKVAAGITSINIAFMKHRALHGGGVFVRLDEDLSGAFIEQASDPGSSDSTLSTLAVGVIDHQLLLSRHSINNIVVALENVSKQNPDLFNEIDKAQNVSWDDAVSIPPPLIEPIPYEIEKALEKGKIIAMGYTSKKYAPFQIVPLNEISSIVRVDGMGKIVTDRINRLRKKRKRKDGEYHGYL